MPPRRWRTAEHNSVHFPQENPAQVFKRCVPNVSHGPGTQPKELHLGYHDSEPHRGGRSSLQCSHPTRSLCNIRHHHHPEDLWHNTQHPNQTAVLGRVGSDGLQQCVFAVLLFESCRARLCEHAQTKKRSRRTSIAPAPTPSRAAQSMNPELLATPAQTMERSGKSRYAASIALRPPAQRRVASQPAAVADMTFAVCATRTSVKSLRPEDFSAQIPAQKNLWTRAQRAVGTRG